MSADPSQEANPFAAPQADAFRAPVAANTGELATRMERFAGAFIDGIIVLPIVFGAGIVLGIVIAMTGIDPESPLFNILATVFGGILGMVVFIAIHGYLLATRGQTVGKLAVKTQIVSEKTGQILPFGEIILKRYLPIWVLSSIPLIGALFGLANSLAIFRANKKCIHDEIAGTKVIKLQG